MDGLYILDIDDSFYNSSYLVPHDDIIFYSIKWNARLGYIGQDRMAKLARVGLMGSLAKAHLPICEPCLAGKATRRPFGIAKRAFFFYLRVSPLRYFWTSECNMVLIISSHLLMPTLDMGLFT